MLNLSQGGLLQTSLADLYYSIVSAQLLNFRAALTPLSRDPDPYSIREGKHHPLAYSFIDASVSSRTYGTASTCRGLLASKDYTSSLIAVTV